LRDSVLLLRVEVELGLQGHDVVSLQC
jgi:hypothetical protein